MIDDFASRERRKPKVIEPPKDDRPHITKLVAREPSEPDAEKLEEEFPGIKPDPPTQPPTGRSRLPVRALLAAKFPDGKWYKLRWPPGKKEWLAAGIVAFVSVAGIGSYLYVQLKPHPGVRYVIKSPYHKPKPPTTVPSTLTGLPVAPAVNERPVTGVMIENLYPDARPQSGLDQAGVVFEAIAEGGITRFLALYQDTSPSYIGPVRSARPYYAEWALGFDAGYAHVGGSPEALADLRSWHVRDLDQFYNSEAYHRILSRYAPHNMYTSMASLNALEKSKGYTTSHYTGFARNTKAVPSKNPTARNIDFTFSGYYYDTHYSYDAKTNSYKRYEGGQPHIEIDAHGHQTQITPKVLLALVMQYHVEADGYHSWYNTISHGPLYVFQDGNVIKGLWQKTSNASQFTFTDLSGQTIKLDPGQTWVSALASTGDIKYTR